MSILVISKVKTLSDRSELTKLTETCSANCTDMVGHSELTVNYYAKVVDSV